MVRAWIMDESDADKRLPHMTEPPQMVDLDYLKELGILYYKIPLCFALMSGKSKKDYSAVFKAVKDLLPEEILFSEAMVDFEEGIWRALQATFPGVNIKGCSFHWRQAVWKHIQSSGLQREYMEHDGTYKLLRKLMVLPLLPHQAIPEMFQKLKEKAGTEKLKELDADNWKEEGKLDEIRKERNYNYEDEVEATRETLPSYDATLEMWYEEHIHSDEEIRFILDGSGYFDVRNRNDKWVRIETEKGDMLILPAGIYHRFTMDTKDFIKAKRLFSGVPVWTAHKRPQEEHESRRNYVKNYSPM